MDPHKSELTCSRNVVMVYPILKAGLKAIERVGCGARFF